MSIPEIPEFKHRPNLKNTVIDLLESIALEEIALSHIVNAEAEKIQAFIGKDLNFPMCSSYQDIIKFNQTINNILSTVLMKEWLLLKKMENVLQIRIVRPNIDEENMFEEYHPMYDAYMDDDQTKEFEGW